MEPCWPACVPVSAPPLALRSSVAFCGPMGELIVIFHLPSTDMRRTSVDEGVHLRGLACSAQGFVDDYVTISARIPKIPFAINRLESSSSNQNRAAADGRTCQSMALYEKAVGVARLIA